jgi:hypothetical protein
MKTPQQLIPMQTGTLGCPAWLSPVPMLYKFSTVSAITLNEIRWRDARGLLWTVPIGFQTDGVSYPWPFSWWSDKFRRDMMLPAIMHDFRYAIHDYCDDWLDDRTDADRDFLAGMRLTHASYAVGKYIGVRLGGNIIYEHKSSEDMMVSWLHAVAEERVGDWVRAIVGDKK